ncbi:MAG: GGDEF domain-containing protein [Candidatus Micrarchaeia archaeon]
MVNDNSHREVKHNGNGSRSLLEREIRVLELGSLRRIDPIISVAEAKRLIRKASVDPELANVFTKIFTRVNELSKENTDLRSKLLTDELTGLGNERRYVEDSHKLLLNYKREFEQYINNKKRNKKARAPRTISFAVLDGNGLKDINDTLGHHFGDIAIKRLGKSISNTVRTSDYVYRKGKGADEFILILNCDKQSTQGILSRIKDELLEINQEENKKLLKENKISFNVAFASGVSNISDIKTVHILEKTPEELAKRLFDLAEINMYNIKKDMKRNGK